MLEPYLDAGYSAFWVLTSENKRAIRDLAKSLGKDRNAAIWNCADGLVFKDQGDKDMTNPVDVLDWLDGAQEDTVLFLENIHVYLNEPKLMIKQMLVNGAERWKEKGKSVVVITSSTNIPQEVDKVFRVMDFDLPTKVQLSDILTGVCKDAEVKFPKKKADTILNASLGLTATEAENALALTLVHEGKHFDINMILEQKAQMIKKNSSLDFGVYSERFKDIGGHDNLKSFCSITLKSDLAKGVLLLGVSGTGKSMFAKALGNETNLPTLFLDMGSVFGRYIGESESKMKAVLQIVTRMRPCILFIDEFEKGVSGSQSSGKTDSGVTSRVIGQFLTFMQDKPEGIYVVATCNNIDALPPEMLRADRWDGIFFVDLPTPEERKVILEIYRKFYGIKDTIDDALLRDWTGAEIKQLCKNSKMMKTSLKQAIRFVIPIARSRSMEIKELREWAKNNTIPSSTPIVNGESKTKRKVRVK